MCQRGMMNKFNYRGIKLRKKLKKNHLNYKEGFVVVVVKYGKIKNAYIFKIDQHSVCRFSNHYTFDILSTVCCQQTQQTRVNTILTDIEITRLNY